MKNTHKNFPVIGLTTYGKNAENRYHLPVEYVASVRRAGGLPWLIAPGEPRPDEILAHLDAIIFTGGGDIDPQRYNGRMHPLIDRIDTERDETELLLIDKVFQINLPTLCICRGLQLLNVALGGSLIEHLPDVTPGTVPHRKPPRPGSTHLVTIDRDSQLAKITGDQKTEGVSWHHQAIRKMADGLKTVAFACDGVIEAVEMPGRPNLLAVQWHPEMSSATDPQQQRLFDWLVEKAKNFI